MQAMLHGVRRVDMSDSQTGRQVRGFTCFISYPSEGVQGEEVDRKFISDDIATSSAWSPEVGKPVMIDFTPKGKVSSISTVREK